MNARKLPLATLWRSDIAPRPLADRRLNGRVWNARCAGCPWQPLLLLKIRLRATNRLD